MYYDGKSEGFPEENFGVTFLPPFALARAYMCAGDRYIRLFPLPDAASRIA